MLCLIVALGLVVCCLAEDRSRETLDPNPWIYWVGIILIVAPIAYRATAVNISSMERFLLVGVEGLAIYLAREMRDPYGYTLTDDFSHALGLEHVLSTHHLYHSDVLLPIVAHYPGLEAATAAIAQLTGMSTWGAGVLFVGACRVTLMLALYVLFTGISRSARVGALGALLFAANSNFMYFETEFAYESLSLPLLIVALAAMAERQRAGNPLDLRAWSLVAGVTIVSIISTHHLTSYALVVILWLMCLKRVWLPRPFKPIDLQQGPAVWPFALLTTLLALAWLLVVASQTVGYVSPDIVSAFDQAFKTVTGTDQARGLFSNTAGTSAGSNNLKSEELVSFLEPVMLLVAGAIGVRTLFRAKHIEAVVVVLSVMAVAYFGATALRVVPSAWEIGNRGAEFAFIGMSFVVGAATLRKPRLWTRPWMRALVGLALGLAVVGAAIAGESANARLAHPTQYTAFNGHRVLSQTLAVARFFRRLPPGAAIADDADAMAIDVFGNHVAYTGPEYSADGILSTAGTFPGEVATIRDEGIRYVVIDFRQRSQDTITGLYIDQVPPAAPVDTTFKAGIVDPWVGHAAQVYDSGDIVVFDLDRRP